MGYDSSNDMHAKGGRHPLCAMQNTQIKGVIYAMLLALCYAMPRRLGYQVIMSQCHQPRYAINAKLVNFLLIHLFLEKLHPEPCMHYASR